MNEPRDRAPAVSVPERIRALLDQAGVGYRHVHHQAVRTSEQAARVRGEPLAIGGKALVVKLDGRFRLFVLSAALRLDSTAVRGRFATRRIRFASAQELLALTGLVPGSVPPFGQPILPLPLHVDPSVLANDRIAFNAGSLTDSIIMAAGDYRRLAGGDVFPFAEAGG